MSTLTLLASTALLAGPLSSVFGSHEMIFWKGALWISGALWLIYIICVGLDDIAKHAKNAFKYNLIALVVVFVGVLVYAMKHDSSGNLITPTDGDQPSKGFAAQQLAKFKSGEGRELWDKIKELELQEELLVDRIDKFRDVLKLADIDPSKNEEYKAKLKKQDKLRAEIQRLKENFMKAFVAWQDYELGERGSEEDQWKQLLADGEQDAERLKNQYEDFKREAEGNRTETPGDANVTEANKTDED